MVGNLDLISALLDRFLLSFPVMQRVRVNLQIRPRRMFQQLVAQRHPLDVRIGHREQVVLGQGFAIGQNRLNLPLQLRIGGLFVSAETKEDGSKWLWRYHSS